MKAIKELFIYIFLVILLIILLPISLIIRLFKGVVNGRRKHIKSNKYNI